jgi:hypothetical protein
VKVQVQGATVGGFFEFYHSGQFVEVAAGSRLSFRLGYGGTFLQDSQNCHILQLAWHLFGIEAGDSPLVEFFNWGLIQ